MATEEAAVVTEGVVVVVVEEAGVEEGMAAVEETDTVHRPVPTTASLWRTSLAVAAGRTSRYGDQ